MNVGTKSLLFGVHQFLWHAHTVELAWRQIYGTPTFREQICILIHDWGYWGSPEMDGRIGSTHPVRSAKIAFRLGLGFEAYQEVLNHSRHLAFSMGRKPSRLCWADKLSMLHDPEWFYLLRARLSGELREYRANAARVGFIGLEATDREWLQKLKAYLQALASKEAGTSFSYTAKHGGGFIRTVGMLLFVFSLALGQPVPARAGVRPDVIAAAHAGLSDSALLKAIAAVEGWHGGRGAAGEIGPWQMMPAVWARYHGTPRERAEQHLEALRGELATLGAEPLPFNMALAWNAGAPAAASGRAKQRHYDYARRVVALLEKRGQ